MTYNDLIKEITDLNQRQGRSNSSLPHCSNLLYQLSKQETGKLEYYSNLVEKYLATRTIICNSSDLQTFVISLSTAINEYMSCFWPPEKNPFSAQADFNSSIIPEMLCTAFWEVSRIEDLGLEVSAQKNLTIECTFDLTNGGSVHFKNKRVDVAVVKPCKLCFNSIDMELPIPLLAIECKTNLDKNMISGIEHSVEELKKTFPSCLYYVVTELSDFDVQNNYASSGIDEMYILRRQKRAPVRRNPAARQMLDSNLIFEVVNNLQNAIASMRESLASLECRMDTGKLIGRIK